MARSAPEARSSSSASLAWGGPMVMTVMSPPPVCSTSCFAAVRACFSYVFTRFRTPSRLMVLVVGSNSSASRSGTCLMQMAIFMCGCKDKVRGDGLGAQGWGNGGRQLDCEVGGRVALSAAVDSGRVGADGRRRAGCRGRQRWILEAVLRLPQPRRDRLLLGAGKQCQLLFAAAPGAHRSHRQRRRYRYLSAPVRIDRGGERTDAERGDNARACRHQQPTDDAVAGDGGWSEWLHRPDPNLPDGDRHHSLHSKHAPGLGVVDGRRRLLWVIGRRRALIYFRECLTQDGRCG